MKIWGIGWACPSEKWLDPQWFTIPDVCPFITSKFYRPEICRIDAERTRFDMICQDWKRILVLLACGNGGWLQSLWLINGRQEWYWGWSSWPKIPWCGVEIENMGMNVFVISFCTRREMFWSVEVIIIKRLKEIVKENFQQTLVVCQY